MDKFLFMPLTESVASAILIFLKLISAEEHNVNICTRFY